MSKETKIVQIVVVDGEAAQIAALRNELLRIKDKLDFDAEFIITNDKVRFQDVGVMIKELYKLYKSGEDVDKE